jgi:NADH-quinone oxidoreductase subunit K
MFDSEMAILHHYLTIGAIVFGLGVVGFLARRNMIVMFLSAEMMLQGVSLSLVAWSRFHNDWGGQILVIFIIAVAACEAAIALALVLVLFKRTGHLDVATSAQLREDNLPPFIDREVPEEVRSPERAWPHLTPAGVEPDVDEERLLERPHV